MEDDQWVLVRRPKEKDWWSPRAEDADSEKDTKRSKPLKVTFTDPAKYWTDAIPIGCGRLGAMVWGGVGSEIIQLNEDTLWTGSPGNYTNPEAPEALSEVRKLVDDGQYAEATEAAIKLTAKPADVYQLLGDIKLEFDDSHVAYGRDTYHRELNLDTATVQVKYTVGEVEFLREHFASRPDKVIATKISGSKSGSLTFAVSFDCKLDHHSYINGKTKIIMEGSCPEKRIPPTLKPNGNPRGIQFSAVLDIQISKDRGVIRVLDDKKLIVEGSDWAVLLLVASSSFEGSFSQPSESRKDPTSDCLSVLQSLMNLSYSDLYARHLDDYQNLFHRVSLVLSTNSKNMTRNVSAGSTNFPEGSEDYTVSTAERIQSFKRNEDPSLVELLFQFGRYLLISCSRPGTQVANLQGIWNKDIQPKWDHRLLQVNYEASGWVVHHKSDIWAKSSADYGEVLWALWPMGGAWLCTHLWEHYTFTLEKDFLKDKAYPLLEGCASFLLDWLIEGPSGYLETNPSTSPEHVFIAPDGKPACVSYSSTMDMSIIKEVFSAIVSAAEVLGKMEDALIGKVCKAQQRLYPTKIAKDGSIMEWAQDFGDPDVHHRHLSHLFGLFPGHTITVEKTPALCKAAENTLYKRGEDGPGWSTSWKIALWARLRSSEHAYHMVKHLFKLVDPDHEVAFEGGLYSNLFAAHPPFQIDANFGFSAAIAEMLVQSTLEDIFILPALPREKWPNGCVKGLKARGGLTVSISWKEGDLHEVGVWSKDHKSSKRLHYRGTIVTANISSGGVYTFDSQLKCVNMYSLAEVSFPSM
ncbi:alpha-L-fucosidase 2-like isoform X2 [Tripterygium wilfordii]|uniref:alpha-L-fucosidase 2-like isoform X2 n=1 Tax=Tripterygium wilfordii TaxID=458696 RepID=UPI0018F7EE08|nr:alpha-L-fucosidase 2-like isoform X2 [Tripterygium wilfordii]